jgi:hypothetical protein
MKKHAFLLLIICALSVSTIGQTVSKKLEKVKTDPKTKENAARADASVVDKKKITSDSATILKPMPIKRKRMRGVTE